MSTRGLHCIYMDGEYKVANYNHFDSYPEGSGVELLSTLRDIVEDRQLDSFKLKVLETKRTDTWSEDEVEGNTYKAVLESTHGLKLYDDLQFVTDSLFNEWTYVCDLDNNTFEVYKGFNKIPLSKGERFYDFQFCKHLNDCYYPVRYVASFDLDELPSDEEFLRVISERVK